MKEIVFRVHAIQRMFERNISRDDVLYVINNGEVIREYPDDTPFPSRLILAWRNKRPLHVVIAESAHQIIVITAYEPDPNQWEQDFRKKKEQDS